MTDPQDMHLHAAIKRAMGSYYDTKSTCVYNVTKLVNKCDDLSELMERWKMLPPIDPELDKFVRDLINETYRITGITPLTRKV